MRDDIEEMRRALRVACADAGSLLVEASISNQERMPTFGLGFAAFLSTLHAERPKVIFLTEATFDVAELIEGKVSDAIERRFEDDVEHDAEVARIGEIVRTQAAQDILAVEGKEGAVYLFVSRYVEQGALRATSHCAEWALGIESRIADLVEAYVGKWSAEQNAVVSAKERARRAAAEVAVATLVNDPEFRRLKGVPKRSAYVQSRYPDLVPPDEQGRQARAGQNLPLIDAAICDVIRTAHMQVKIAEDSKS